MSKETPFTPETRFRDELTDGFADPVTAASFPKHILRWRNDKTAQDIGLAPLSDADWIAHFGAFNPLPGAQETPLAQRYHGHQFRTYNPQLGDGRGFLFAQLRDTNGRLMDLGTKGSGTTPYSRGGDGKLTLKGAVRELLASEMLEALGADTSRTFSIIETGEQLVRGDEPSPTRSAVLVRLTHGHIRIGTFQRHAFASDTARLKQLVLYCLKNYFRYETNELTVADIQAFLTFVGRACASQAADLMASGFVHGVLNTDNINITGEIFDFGPWRFLPRMDMGFTAAYFDETGLYAYGRQPETLRWNLYQLASTFLDLASETELRAAIDGFPHWYEAAFRKKLLERLGLKAMSKTADETLMQAISQFLARTKMPFEQFFFDWYGGQASANRALKSGHAALYQAQEHSDLFAQLQTRQPRKDSAAHHTYFQGKHPQTLLIEEVEALWAPINERDDWAPLTRKIDAIRSMGRALGNDHHTPLDNRSYDARL